MHIETGTRETSDFVILPACSSGIQSPGAKILTK